MKLYGFACACENEERGRLVRVTQGNKDCYNKVRALSLVERACSMRV